MSISVIIARIHVGLNLNQVPLPENLARLDRTAKTMALRGLVQRAYAIGQSASGELRGRQRTASRHGRIVQIMIKERICASIAAAKRARQRPRASTRTGDRNHRVSSPRSLIATDAALA